MRMNENEQGDSDEQEREGNIHDIWRKEINPNIASIFWRDGKGSCVCKKSGFYEVLSTRIRFCVDGGPRENFNSASHKEIVLPRLTLGWNVSFMLIGLHPDLGHKTRIHKTGLKESGHQDHPEDYQKQCLLLPILSQLHSTSQTFSPNKYSRPLLWDIVKKIVLYSYAHIGHGHQVQLLAPGNIFNRISVKIFSTSLKLITQKVAPTSKFCRNDCATSPVVLGVYPRTSAGPYVHCSQLPLFADDSCKDDNSSRSVADVELIDLSTTDEEALNFWESGRVNHETERHISLTDGKISDSSSIIESISMKPQQPLTEEHAPSDIPATTSASSRSFEFGSLDRVSENNCPLSEFGTEFIDDVMNDMKNRKPSSSTSNVPLSIRPACTSPEQLKVHRKTHFDRIMTTENWNEAYQQILREFQHEVHDQEYQNCDEVELSFSSLDPISQQSLSAPSSPLNPGYESQTAAQPFAPFNVVSEEAQACWRSIPDHLKTIEHWNAGFNENIRQMQMGPEEEDEPGHSPDPFSTIAALESQSEDAESDLEFVQPPGISNFKEEFEDFHKSPDAKNSSHWRTSSIGALLDLEWKDAAKQPSDKPEVGLTHIPPDFPPSHERNLSLCSSIGSSSSLSSVSTQQSPIIPSPTLISSNTFVSN
ncbi:uncharacterized protein MELLADRAFT_101743 [Melampsora larici-populina 98AG31]|uniref:Uncharacterized protein n=1 Tax=Melampsora larici-populina (strain 98AG31 / pathotype 3-4-7) TaxID=747676 RepID=F4R6U0_MELLP|nr:uncharacterized protein MELLADRAFT_101743 [Melampsora larici-populina 98AG31]EGG12397.1 hypothetical protein MELLADRAFT_101743 [Melampsora larici-populina 98AG31]